MMTLNECALVYCILGEPIKGDRQYTKEEIEKIEAKGASVKNKRYYPSIEESISYMKGDKNKKALEESDADVQLSLFA